MCAWPQFSGQVTAELLVLCADRLAAHLTALEALARADRGALPHDDDAAGVGGAGGAGGADGGEMACAAALPPPIRRLLHAAMFYLAAARGGGEGAAARADEDEVVGSGGESERVSLQRGRSTGFSEAALGAGGGSGGGVGASPSSASFFEVSVGGSSTKKPLLSSGGR